MDYFIIAAIAFYLGYKLNEKIMWFTFGKMMKEAGITNKQLDQFINHWAPGLNDEVKSLSESAIEIRLEQHNNILYAYRKDNEEFLGQGPDQETLFKIITDRFQNHKFVVHSADGAELLEKTRS